MNRNILSYILLSGIVFSQPNGRSIMEKVDQIKSPYDIQTQIKMTLISNKGGKKRSRSRVLTSIEKKYENGIFKTKSLLLFSQPKEIKGTAFLNWDRVDGKGDDQWLYLPALKKVKRIRTSDKSRSFQGSDFSYEDLSGRELDSDEYKLLGEDLFAGSVCYKVRAIPLEKETQYSSRIIWIDKNNFLMKKIEFFNKKNNLFKVLDIPNHVKNGDYWTATKMTMQNLMKSHSTELKVIEVNYDQGLKDNIFTERYLKRQ